MNLGKAPAPTQKRNAQSFLTAAGGGAAKSQNPKTKNTSQGSKTPPIHENM